MDLLRLATAGSVDDGKSTLIGRLLYESGSVPKDKLAAIEAASRRRGAEGLDLSLLTDGLIAEREQGITIDVAHVYFATPTRRYIIADTPGHVEYTRNMVTGASTASVSVILIDARNGLLEQTHRHYYISALLRIPTVVVAINKMDLVDYSQTRFDEIAAAFRAMAAPVQPAGQTLRIMPVSSLHGENITRRSAHLDWYDGPTLLEVLETADAHQRSTLPGRLQIQRVLRPRNEGALDIRSYAGRIASGTFRVGDAVTVLPGGRQTRISALAHLGTPVEAAEAGQSVSVDFVDDVDVGRGSLVVPTPPEGRVGTTGPTSSLLPDGEGEGRTGRPGPAQLPSARQQLDATVCWLDEQPLRLGRVYLVQHGVQRVRAKVTAITGLVDVSTLQIGAPPDTLQLNQLATVSLKLAEPVVVDAYEENPPNGAFIVVDADTSATAAVGFVAADRPAADDDF
ncbi:MAG TPA: GTP-binding protein [Luteitalea sp.]|nr:GTP-binding protein [Luteitalea sp.]